MEAVRLVLPIPGKLAGADARKHRAAQCRLQGHLVSSHELRSRRRRPLQVTPLGLGSSNALFGSHCKSLLLSQRILYTRSSHGRRGISATARPMDVNDGSVARDAKNLMDAGASWFDAFYRFTRPHTIYGSALGVISVSLLAVQSSADFTGTFFVGLLQALVPALLMNVYIVGLNQIYDIEIDKVNKPYLPLASGEFSLITGITLVTICAALSLAIGVVVGSRPLLWALTVSLVLGTAYSADIPFLRWKKSAVAAASCILAVRAVVVQLGFYLHMHASVLGRSALLTKPLYFAMAFMCFFSIVIALAKDIPDVEGDKVFGIRSFSVRMGQTKIFWTCVGLLQCAYAAAITFGLISCTTLWSRAVMGLGHATLAAALWFRSQNVDMKSRSAVASWYMFIWKLFYAEYLLIPLIR